MEDILTSEKSGVGVQVAVGGGVPVGVAGTVAVAWGAFWVKTARTVSTACVCRTVTGTGVGVDADGLQAVNNEADINIIIRNEHFKENSWS